MIHNLRRQHRITVVLLAVVLAIVFMAGLFVRQPPPINPSLPNSLLPSATGGQR